MPLFNPHQLREIISFPQRVLGIDPGKKRIGLAITDVSLILASPLKIMKKDKLSLNIKEFYEICHAYDIGGIVIGLPMSMDGRFMTAARSATGWGRELSERLKIPATMWDERLSSSAVERFLINDVDMSRQKRTKVVDKMAASYILQNWLNATKNE